MKLRVYADILGTLNRVSSPEWDGRSLYYSPKDRLPVAVMEWLRTMLLLKADAGSVTIHGTTYSFNVPKKHVGLVADGGKLDRSSSAGRRRPKDAPPVAPKVAKEEPWFDPIQRHLDEMRAKAKAEAMAGGDARFNPELDEVFA